MPAEESQEREAKEVWRMTGFWWGVIAGVVGLWTFSCVVLAVLLWLVGRRREQQAFDPRSLDLGEITITGQYDDTGDYTFAEFQVPFSHVTNFGEDVKGDG